MKDTWPCGTPRSRNNALDWRRSDAAITALREALSAPEPEPVALESVHLTRDTKGMCVVRVNGRVAIRDNGDIIDHMATLEWFAAPPAAPDHFRDVAEKVAPAAPVVPDLKHCACEFDGDACVTQCKLHAAHVDAIHEWAERAKAAEAKLLAAPVVREPLTEEQIRSMWRSSKFRGNGGQADWFCEGMRAAEAHHGITGASK